MLGWSDENFGAFEKECESAVREAEYLTEMGETASHVSPEIMKFLLGISKRQAQIAEILKEQSR